VSRDGKSDLGWYQPANMEGSIHHILFSLSLFQVVTLNCLGFLAYVFSLYLYRLTLHPLSRFPGPKLAGLSYWYEYYYDVHKKGRFIFKVKELHEQYGPTAYG
jgi:hypothetical protein